MRSRPEALLRNVVVEDEANKSAMMMGEFMSVYELVVCITRILALGGSANSSLSAEKLS
jgi:hypothetical protein